MNTEVWLTIKAVKKYQSWEVTKVNSHIKKPKTDKNEVAIKITLDISDSLFEEPVFEAKITLPDKKKFISVKDAMESEFNLKRSNSMW